VKQSNKINRALFNSLNATINNPFMVLDRKGNILSLNKEAESLFSIKPETENIFDLFNEQSSSVLNKLFETLYLNKKPVAENITLKLTNEEELNLQVNINSYKEENEYFIFCTFKYQNYSTEAKGTTKFQIVRDINDFIKNKDILNIIEDIKSLYPFTFIGKEKIVKKVNNIEELFWVKDNKGIYVLVNEKLALGLGLKPSQIEGKPAKTFLPSYLIDFYNSLENYLKISINNIIIEGAPLSGLSSLMDYQTIEVPLIDSENNVIAVIGIAQKTEKKELKSKEETFLSPSILIDNFLKPFAVIDKNGIIKHASLEFCKLFPNEFNNFVDVHFAKILSSHLSEKIQQFITELKVSEKFELEIKNNTNKFVINLNKILDDNNEIKAVSILLDESQTEDNLEQIINKRGRMFDILIQNNPEPIFIYDTENLRFIEVNEAALDLYGYRKDEFLQMDLTDLYTPEDIQTLLDSSSFASKEGKFTGPFKHKKKDGSYVYVEISKISFNYKDKNAHFNIIKDVSEKLDVDKKNQLFKTVFDNTDSMLFVTDHAGFIIYSNNSVYDILEYSKNDIENTLFTAFFRNEERGNINSAIFQSHLKESVKITSELKHKNGAFIKAEITASPVLNYKNEVDSFSIICKIVKQKAEPEIVYIEKPAASSAAETSAEETPKETGTLDVNFLSTLFHELLTPINVILGFVQELVDSLDNLTPEQKEASDFINQNRERLLNIMNSVVEYTNIQQSNYDLKPQEIGITEIIDQLQTDYEVNSRSREVEFAYGKISSSLKFVSDKQKFQNFIFQLVKTIAKVTKEKKIYFSAYSSDENNFVVSIRDNYSSSSKYLCDNLVNIFLEGNETNLKNIGLSRFTARLLRAYLSLLNGKFELIDASANKTDCSFIFPIKWTKPSIQKEKVHEDAKEIEKEVEPTLERESEEEIEEPKPAFTEQKVEEKIEFSPAEKESFEEEDLTEDIGYEQIKPSEKSYDRIDLKALNCLYIEDQVDSQILFKVQMKELKEIKFAVSFEEALPLLDSNHFDFIVMDINLQGDYNGLDALKIIHKMPGYESIPVIAVTAYVLPGDKEKFIATGFNDFISKPIFRDKMVDSLEKIFLMQF